MHAEPMPAKPMRGRLSYHQRDWDRQVADLVAQKTRFFCLEIEVDARDQESLKKLASDARWHATKDGSLRGQLGVELVVQPIVWGKGLVTRLHDTLGDVSGKAIGHAASSDGYRYGMHINISKSAWRLTALELGKLLVFVNSHVSIMEQIAQRTVNRYCQAKHKRIVDGRSNTEKFEILHIDNDRLEFRIFRSNTRVERIAKNCECVASLVEFVKAHGIRDLTSQAYFSWLEKTKPNDYRNLKTFLHELGLMEYKPKKMPNEEAQAVLPMDN
jgi:hypothetical protein